MNEVRICLAGEMRSGKTTIADYARNVHNMVPFAFGDALKDQFHAEYAHIPREPKPRKGYQLYGQLKRYALGQDIWVNQCFTEINRIRLVSAAYNITGSEVDFMPIITDARQPNEFEKCREMGYAIIKIEATEHIRMDRAKLDGDDFSPEDMYHETELYVKSLKPDYTIYNNGSIEDLYEQFNLIVQSIKNNNTRMYGGEV